MLHEDRIGIRPKNYLIDMDGVLISGLPFSRADQFIERLKARQVEFLVLTDNPLYTRGDLAHRLQTMGLDIPSERIFTSAMATARFLDFQKPKGTAYVIGESGLTWALHELGYVITDIDPDYVVLGERFLQPGADHQGHPVGGRRRAFHRHEP